MEASIKATTFLPKNDSTKLSVKPSGYPIFSSTSTMTAPVARKVRVAAVQAEPVWNDLQGGLEKVISLLGDAGKEGADVVGFPEVFIPGYPW